MALKLNKNDRYYGQRHSLLTVAVDVYDLHLFHQRRLTGFPRTQQQYRDRFPFFLVLDPFVQFFRSNGLLVLLLSTTKHLTKKKQKKGKNENKRENHVNLNSHHLFRVFLFNQDNCLIELHPTLLLT